MICIQGCLQVSWNHRQLRFRRSFHFSVCKFSPIIRITLVQLWVPMAAWYPPVKLNPKSNFADVTDPDRYVVRVINSVSKHQTNGYTASEQSKLVVRKQFCTNAPRNSGFKSLAVCRINVSLLPLVFISSSFVDKVIISIKPYRVTNKTIVDKIIPFRLIYSQKATLSFRYSYP